MYRKSIQCFLVVLVFLMACKGSRKSLENTEELKFEDVVEVFPNMKSNAVLADSSLHKKGDSTVISQEIWKKFVPDSVISILRLNEKTPVRVLGKIKNENEIYLLSISSAKNKAVATAVLFDATGKYLNVFRLLSSERKNGYSTTVTITNEPTFVISTSKKISDEETKFTKNGYAYNHDAKFFMVVVHESNEEKATAAEEKLLNPLDTLPAKNLYSGDYRKDDNNILTIRDGKNQQHYLFFIHFKKKNDCMGELKGELQFVDEKKAIFQKSGDPCVIDFMFSKNNTVKVKEQGSCGNHRGIKCFFDDSYTKIKAKATNKK